MTMTTSRGFWKHDPDSLCYVCGTFISAKSARLTIVEGNLFCAAFYAYFGVQVGDQDKAWEPHVVCGNFRSTLEAWYRGESRRMKFGVQRLWREPLLLHGYGDWSSKRKKTDVFDYPDLPSSLQPVKHCSKLSCSKLSCISLPSFFQQ